jgi:hypothetical protein
MDRFRNDKFDRWLTQMELPAVDEINEALTPYIRGLKHARKFEENLLEMEWGIRFMWRWDRYSTWDTPNVNVDDRIEAVPLTMTEYYPGHINIGMKIDRQVQARLEYDPSDMQAMGHLIKCVNLYIDSQKVQIVEAITNLWVYGKMPDEVNYGT